MAEQEIQVEEEVENPFDFYINWENVNNVKSGRGEKKESARDIISKGKTPSNNLKDKIVYEIIEQVSDRWPLATRKSMETVYSLMLAKHRQFFKENLGSQNTAFSGGWLYKLKNRLDNSRRLPGNSAEATSDARYERGPGQKCSYACKRWRVRDFPDGETTDSQETDKEWLKREYTQVPLKDWNWHVIQDKMTKTYKSQRDLINENMEKALKEAKEARQKKRSKKKQVQEREEDVDEVQAPTITIAMINMEWPFLFTYKGMLTHFSLLTERDLEKDFEEFQTNVLPDLMEFFKRKDNDSFDRILRKMEAAQKKHPRQNQKLKALVLIAAQYFEEDAVLKLDEKTLTLDDLAEKGPQFPGLTALGVNIFKAKKLVFGLDSRNYFAFLDFEKAFKTLFMSFFVFNINYPPEIQVTMEFFQRYIFSIDEPTGNRRPNQSDGAVGHFSSLVIHPKIGRFHTQFESSKPKRRRRAQERDEAGLTDSDELSR